MVTALLLADLLRARGAIRTIPLALPRCLLVSQGKHARHLSSRVVAARFEPRCLSRVVPETPATFTNGGQAMQDFLRWIGSSDGAIRVQVEAQYHCDAYLCFDTPPVPRAYWERQFGRDRAGQEKGIAVLAIPGGVQ
jgi:hypothetical protein